MLMSEGGPKAAEMGLGTSMAEVVLTVRLVLMLLVLD
jgi:hypothetical protein